MSVNSPSNHRPRRMPAPAVLLVALLLAACGLGDKGAGAGVGGTASLNEAQLMDQGTRLLYQGSDPLGAERAFREVLRINPSHYGAQFQLAMALDRGGKPTEARPVWENVLKSATTANDSATALTARSRLAAPDTASPEASMALGLDLLYRQNAAELAAAQFRKVLQRNPRHYGATYQLATALDRQGKKSEARPLWEKVLGMATAYKDQAAADTARQHLK